MMVWRKAFGGMFGLAIAMGVGRFAFTPILPGMQAEAGLGDDGAGLLASLNYAGYFAGALLATRVPRGPVRTAAFRFCLLLSLATTAGMAASPAFAVWAVLRLTAGLASAGMLILGSAMVLDALAAAGRGALAGLTFGGVGLGIAGSGAAVAALDAGWRADWLVLAAGCLALAPPAWFWVTDPPGAADAGTPGGGRGIRASRPLLLLTTAYFLEGAGYIVTGTFLVALLARLPETAGIAQTAWIVVGLSGAVSVVFWSWAGKRLGLRPALAAAHLVQAAAILAPVVSAGPAAAIAGAIGFGGTFMGITALTLALGRDLAAGRSGPVIGLLTAAFALGQVLAPYPAGLLLAATRDFDVPLAAAAGLVLAGALLVALSVPRRRSFTPSCDRSSLPG
ncbi:MAG TPA: YbfB/YjiJ family MFS transporter [Arenibaculum sp.]|nr:YbfB/YjiJ family MFS transporter [Arenibaculum sp.]